MSRAFALILPVALVALCLACGGDNDDDAGAATSAEALVQQLKDAGLPVAETIVYTAETDSNHLLGRPNGYEGKSNFHDSRLKADPDFRLDAGGSIELFPDGDGAKARKDYIDAIGKNIPTLSEYSYTNGRALLRLSRALTPDQAKAYAEAFDKLRVH